MDTFLREETGESSSLHRTRTGAWWVVGGFGAALLLAQYLALYAAYDAESQASTIAIPVSWSAVLLGILYAEVVSGHFLELPFLLLLGLFGVVFLGTTATAMRTLLDTRSADRRTTKMLIVAFAFGSLAWAIGDWENRRAIYGTGLSVALLAASLLLAITILMLLQARSAAGQRDASLAPALLMQCWLQTAWLPAAPAW